LLGGWSFGGVVAYSLAAQLASDDRPERLLLLDTIAPIESYTSAGREVDQALALRWFTMYLAAKRGGHLPLDAAGAGEHSADLATGLARLLAAATEAGVLRRGTELAGLRKVFDTYHAGLVRNNLLVKGYLPAACQLPITLVRPRSGLLGTPAPLGWEEITDELTVLRCAGDHYSMLREPDAHARIADFVGDRQAVTETAA
jgi:thioesterase domain-containing protein